jgi:heat shock protein HspQ
MAMSEPKKLYAHFTLGQTVHHRLFDYRGVIVDVDSEYQGSEEWYERVARSRPPKDKPWYHVLVHDSMDTTYVAERNLEADASGEPVNHPYVPLYFSQFKDGMYVNEKMSN